MSSSGKLKRRRARLHADSPLCRNCGIETVLPETLIERYGKFDRAPLAERIRMATIEHKNSRLNGPRPVQAWGVQTLTLWCFKCNNESNAVAQAALPIEELQRRAGRSKREHGGIGRELPPLAELITKTGARR